METNIQTNHIEMLRSDELFQGAVDEFHYWLLFKVRSQLVLQLYQQEMYGHSFSIGIITDVLREEITSERIRHQESIDRISSESIPGALGKDASTGWFDFAKADIDNLITCRDAHSEMVQYIEDMELANNEWFTNLAQALAEEVYEAAHYEAMLAIAEHNIKSATAASDGFVLAV